jgi:hypothetical protein
MPDRQYVFPHGAVDPVPGNWRTFPFGIVCSEGDSGDGVADSGGGSEIARRKGMRGGLGKARCDKGTMTAYHPAAEAGHTFSPGQPLVKP